MLEIPKGFCLRSFNKLQGIPFWDYLYLRFIKTSVFDKITREVSLRKDIKCLTKSF